MAASGTVTIAGARNRMPEGNRDYWLKKIAQNKERDEAARTALTTLGWDVGIIWEFQMKDRDIVAKKLRSFLG